MVFKTTVDGKSLRLSGSEILEELAPPLPHETKDRVLAHIRRFARPGDSLVEIRDMLGFYDPQIFEQQPGSMV